MEIKIATEIETSLFYAIIKYLKKNNWIIIAEYDNRIFDKGIDFDLYQFRKGDELITLVWNNWTEGEIKSSSLNLETISNSFNVNFQYNEPEYLKNPNLLEDLGILIKYYNTSFYNKLKNLFNRN